jgi:hypothetical protein
MTTYPVFVEVQRFRQIWLIALLLVMNVFCWVGLFVQLVLEIPVGNNPISNEGFVIIALSIALFTALFFLFNLKTKIDRTGIHFKFSPFHLKQRCYRWDEIEKVYVRTYKPIREYGGWGIRFGANGKAFNVSGNQGLQIEFKSGRKVLIGTNKPEELTKVLQNLN